MTTKRDKINRFVVDHSFFVPVPPKRVYTSKKERKIRSLNVILKENVEKFLKEIEG